MKTLTLTSALALLLGISAAQASVLIGLQQAGVNGGAITTQITDGDFASWAGSYGTFNINAITGAVPPATVNILDSTALNISGQTPGELKVYVTSTNQSGGQFLSFLSSLTENILPTGWKATLATYVDTTNTPYGLTTNLASHEFNAIGTNVSTLGLDLPALYSITAVYDLVSTGLGTSLATIHVSASNIPEPSSILLLLGALGWGYLAYRNKPA